MKDKKVTINVQDTSISILTTKESDFFSLTDIARYRNKEEPFSIINNWMRSRSTISFLGLWENLHNPNFKPVEFDRFKNEAFAKENLLKLNQIAIRQLKSLIGNSEINKLKE